MPRFVLLRHECPSSFGKPSHWDFMLEWGGVLRTWDLRDLPLGWAESLQEISEDVAVTARLLPDHRTVYLDYEGPLTDNRGSVQRCDAGTYEILHKDEQKLHIHLAGEHWQGEIRLTNEAGDWLLKVLN